MPDKIRALLKGFKFREQGVLLGFVVLCIIISLLTPGFL